MAKCDFETVFDHPDRIYRAGEQVSGRVIISVNEAVRCRGIKLRGYWKTHGRGNRATDEYFRLDLDPVEMQAGQTYEYPFSFTAPDYPWTYRGHYLNVDHYLLARIDVPWAFDPKSETEFMIEPGVDDPSCLAHLTPKRTAGGTSNKVVLIIVGTIFTLVGIPFIMMMGFGCIFVAVGLLLLYLALRNQMAEKRLGAVNVEVTPQWATPGSQVNVTLGFRPRMSGKINRVSLTLAGKEVVVSGSGTNRSTHTHKLHETEIVAREAFAYRAGEAVTIQHSFPLPNLSAFTLDLKDNRLVWSVGVKLDVPRWPDWYDEQEFVVFPSTQFPTSTEPRGSLPPIVEASPAIDDTPSRAKSRPPVSFPEAAPPPTTPEWQASAEPTPSPASASTDPASSITTSPELQSLSRELAAADRFGDERQTLLNAQQGRTFGLLLEVERTSYTYGVLDAPDFAEGRTVAGIDRESRQRYSIQLPEQDNDRVRELHMGDVIAVQGTPIRWDDLYDRLELRGQLD